MKNYPVQVGFAGVASEWLEELPTLTRQQRMRVSAVFDPQPSAAIAGAQSLQATHIKGFVQLLDSQLVDAVIIGNPAWLGWHAVLQCLRRGLPTLLVVSRLDEETFFDDQLPEPVQLQEAMSYARADNGFLMPGLPLRWLPVTIRVRELTATALGAIESLQVTAQEAPLQSRVLAELLDWSLSVVQSAPESIQVQRVDDRLEVVLSCRRHRVDGRPVEVRIRNVIPGSGCAKSSDFDALGYCRHGEFKLTSPTTISHRAERSPVQECLQADRSTFDVMLDLFGRRLVGGVVPVPDFADVLRARNLVLTAVSSLDLCDAIEVGVDGLGI